MSGYALILRHDRWWHEEFGIDFALYALDYQLDIMCLFSHHSRRCPFSSPTLFPSNNRGIA